MELAVVEEAYELGSRPYLLSTQLIANSFCDVF